MDEDIKEVLKILFCVVICAVSVMVFVFLLFTPFYYYESCREAKVFNGKYETEYTCGDFFWAKDQINTQIQTIKLEGLEELEK